MVRRLVAVAALGLASLSAPALAQPLAPAAYTPPAPGTRYVFSNIAHTVTETAGWRTYFTDARGRPGALVGVFIPDNPQSPLTVDERALAKLWPLRLGATTEIATRRAPLSWRWKITVVDTETVTVPAGRFQTYVIEAIETPVISRSPEARANVVTFWYAPAIHAVARFRSGQLVGGRLEPTGRQELLRVERAPVVKR